MSTGFKSIELAKKLYGLSGEEQREFLNIIKWAEENDKAKRYLRLFSKGEITREQFIKACGEIKDDIE